MLSRLTTDTTVIQTAVGSSVSMGLRNAVLFVGGLTMLVVTSPRLMLIVLAVIGLVVLPAVFFGRRVRKLSRASQDRIADSSAIAGEILNAIPVVQSFTQQAFESRRFGAANEHAFETSIRRTRARSLLTAFVIIGVFASLLYGVYSGAQSVIAGAHFTRRTVRVGAVRDAGRIERRGARRGVGRCRARRGCDRAAGGTACDALRHR